MSAAITCRNLRVSRDRTPILHGVDLTVPAGSWVSLVGPNGSGKTTLMFALAGLIGSTGHVEIEGMTPRGVGRRRLARTVAMMPQRPVVPEGVTAHELIALGRTPHIPRFGTESASDVVVVDTIIHRLDLHDLSGRIATTLSGGELQRVVLARALAQQPRVLLLDEPTSALDIGHQQQVLDLVDELRRETGLTVVAAMHDLTSAAQYGERLALLADGRVVADGPPGAVLTAERIAQVYGARVEVVARADGPAVLPLRGAAGAAPGPLDGTGPA
ncbi:MAG TPA: ABC transporter ATP-binding protein [Candidatus Dietzia merdigallinarum]|nr:ABC transporter ATP-binding protein [Candidatus Dietzia merdigallinarum]